MHLSSRFSKFVEVRKILEVDSGLGCDSRRCTVELKVWILYVSAWMRGSNVAAVAKSNSSVAVGIWCLRDQRRRSALAMNFFFFLDNRIGGS